MLGPDGFGDTTGGLAHLLAASSGPAYLYHFPRLGEGEARALGAYHGAEVAVAFGRIPAEGALASRSRDVRRQLLHSRDQDHRRQR